MTNYNLNAQTQQLMLLNTSSNSQLLKPESTINSEYQSQQSQSQEEPGPTSTDIPTHLPCCFCGELLPIDQFGVNNTKPERHCKQNGCISCKAKYDREYAKANPLKKALSSAKYEAKGRKRNVPKEFDLDEEHLKQLDTDTCPLLGIPIQWNVGKHQGKGNAKPGQSWQSKDSKSLDRIRSTKGYLKGNVQIISWRANHLKGDATLEEMVLMGEWAKQQILYETIN